MLWKKFKELANNLTKLGLDVQQGLLYEGVLTDDSLAELKRLLALIDVTECCTSEYKDGEVLRGDIEKDRKTIYVIINKQNLNKPGYYNVKIEYIAIKW